MSSSKVKHSMKDSCIKRKAAQGFTLMELILVIIILGIMSVGISGFITLSTQTYLNATIRDELIGNARFAIERLNRDLRNAVPSSIRIKEFDGNRTQCIQFTPIKASTIYTDIPVLPEVASQTLSVIPFNGEGGAHYECDADCTDMVTVYPLDSGDIYANHLDATGKVFLVDNVDKTVVPWKINILNGAIHFDEDSPTQRLYITEEQVSYCVISTGSGGIGGIMIRYRDKITEGDQTSPGSKPFLMAGYLINDIRGQFPFNYQQATLQRNAVVQIHLHFTKEDEHYVFDHEVHINNVP